MSFLSAVNEFISLISRLLPRQLVLYAVFHCLRLHSSAQNQPPHTQACSCQKSSLSHSFWLPTVRVRPKEFCSSFSLLFSYNLWNLLYTSELLHIATSFTNCSKNSAAQLELEWAKALRTYLCFKFFSKDVKWTKICPVSNQYNQVTQAFLPVCKL